MNNKTKSAKIVLEIEWEAVDELNYMTIVKTSEIIEWVKNAVEKKMIKELNIPNAKVYLSCDRPNPDVILETKNADGDLQIVRFLII